MKQKIMLIILVFMMGTSVDKAQTQKPIKHDVSVFYGIAPRDNFWDHDKYKSTGAFSAQYVFNPFKWLGIGVAFDYQHYNYHNISTANDLLGMIVLRANWINKPNFMLYSRAATGIYLLSDNDNVHKKSTVWQIPSIGMTFGFGKGFFGLAEFSICGPQGLLMLGGGYRF